jgi:alpha(1,3/1,4) fucosyltransferase
MKRILLAIEYADELFYCDSLRDNVSEPYIRLREQLEMNGYIVDTIPKVNIEEYAYIFFKDVYKYQDLVGKIYKEAVNKKLKNNMVLFLSESPIVRPKNYDKRNHSEFGTIFTWRDDYIDGQKYFKYYLPVGLQNNNLFIPFKERKLICDISGNKFSKIKNELYSSRRRIIQFLNKNNPNDFDLYGTGWNNTFSNILKKLIRYRQLDVFTYTSYLGTVKNKNKVVPKYKFVISYENFSQDDYISNRIFDVFMNNAIPVYLGPSNIAKYIPENTFINASNYRSNYDLIYFLINMNEEIYLTYMKNIEKYLKSKEFELFLSSNFTNTIINTLEAKNGGLQ